MQVNSFYRMEAASQDLVSASDITNSCVLPGPLMITLLIISIFFLMTIICIQVMLLPVARYPERETTKKTRQPVFYT